MAALACLTSPQLTDEFLGAGIDVTKIGTFDLRSKIALVPQVSIRALLSMPLRACCSGLTGLTMPYSVQDSMPYHERLLSRLI